MPKLWPCRTRHAPVLIAVSLSLVSSIAFAEEGDTANGARVFAACAACHSLAPGRHRTGPSLAGVLGRKAGTAEGFRRYSPALNGAD
ncbi:MAG: c-type cytochrome, partial [Myxococcota bacterium]